MRDYLAVLVVKNSVNIFDFSFKNLEKCSKMSLENNSDVIFYVDGRLRKLALLCSEGESGKFLKTTYKSEKHLLKKLPYQLKEFLRKNFTNPEALSDFLRQMLISLFCDKIDFEIAKKDNICREILDMSKVSKIPLPFDYAVEQALDSGIVLYSALEESTRSSQVPSQVLSNVPSPVQVQPPNTHSNNVPFPSASSHNNLRALAAKNNRILRENQSSNVNPLFNNNGATYSSSPMVQNMPEKKRMSSSTPQRRAVGVSKVGQGEGRPR